MDMILLDWTRMGKTYCLAGVVSESGTFRVVRPLLAMRRTDAVRNVGWPAHYLDGHARWEVFELVRPEPADVEPPHTEDLWVQALRPRRRSAAPDERRAILAATRVSAGESLFGAALTTTRAAAYLRPGEGRRSLATVVVPSARIWFEASEYEGAADASVRATLPVPGMRERSVAVKDHHLLTRAEHAAGDWPGRIRALNQAVRAMGSELAVRLGLSRAFQGTADRGSAVCWLMADGFFSLADPQP